MAGGKKNKGGRPRKEIGDADWKKLIEMIRIQCTQEEICSIFEMNHETLDARIKERGYSGFSQLYEKHQGKGKASLRRMQWATAKEGNATMQIWLGKQVLGQTDRMDHKSSDGSMSQKSGADKLIEFLDALQKRS